MAVGIKVEGGPVLLENMLPDVALSRATGIYSNDIKTRFVRTYLETAPSPTPSPTPSSLTLHSPIFAQTCFALLEQMTRPTELKAVVVRMQNVCCLSVRDISFYVGLPLSTVYQILKTFSDDCLAERKSIAGRPRLLDHGDVLVGRSSSYS